MTELHLIEAVQLNIWKCVFTKYYTMSQNSKEHWKNDSN